MSFGKGWHTNQPRLLTVAALPELGPKLPSVPSKIHVGTLTDNEGILLVVGIAGQRIGRRWCNVTPDQGTFQGLQRVFNLRVPGYVMHVLTRSAQNGTTGDFQRVRIWYTTKARKGHRLGEHTLVHGLLGQHMIGWVKFTRHQIHVYRLGQIVHEGVHCLDGIQQIGGFGCGPSVEIVLRFDGGFHGIAGKHDADHAGSFPIATLTESFQVTEDPLLKQLHGHGKVIWGALCGWMREEIDEISDDIATIV